MILRMAHDPNFISLEWIPMVEPWEAVFFHVEDFPLAPQELRTLRRLWLSFRHLWVDKGSLSTEVLIHTARMEARGAERFRQYARAWMPQPGLGVWPDRPPPRLPSQADLDDLEPGEKPKPPIEQVLRVTGPPPTKRHALDVMLGFGVVVEVFTADNDFFERARATLLPPIEDRTLRSFPFYAPLLERKSIEEAGSRQLNQWFSGAVAYVRECAEEKGMLIVSHEPLTPMLEQLGAHFERSPAPVWRLPMFNPAANSR
ncbi:MAG TPA: hypothetical protein VMU80_15200 [Bryobacteraceae bacterium]|nr:hypothetical protein [Bryobacteraceae bacterium]